MTFSPERVTELRNMLANGTSGPWEYGDRWHIGGVMPERYGEGRCYACEKHGDPTWVGRRNINGVKMLAHVHTSDKPWHPHGMFAVRDDGPVSVIKDTEVYGYIEPADAALIVAAVNALPELLDELERLRRQKERWKPKMHKSVAKYTEARERAILRAHKAESQNLRLVAGITELIEQNDDCSGFHTCQRDELRTLLEGANDE